MARMGGDWGLAGKKVRENGCFLSIFHTIVYTVKLNRMFSLHFMICHSKKCLMPHISCFPPKKLYRL